MPGVTMTIAFRPTGDQEQRLEALAKRTGRSKSFYLKEALDMHLAELEDTYWAHDVADRWEASDQNTRPLSEIANELGL
jgi:RHH-type rel operon transcriptional repressor/antitoxin RelB